MKRFKNILCVVESETEYKPALERATTLAENNQADLTVAEVIARVAPGIKITETQSSTTDIQKALLNAGTQELDTVVSPYKNRVSIQTRVLTGTPFLEIIRDVLSNGRDLVIKVAETEDWLGRLFGGDDMHLLRKCPCPVWLVKPEAPKSYKRIVAAVDVDDLYAQDELEKRQALNRQILEMAISLALSEFAELHVVHVWHAIGESALRGGFMSTPEDKVLAYVEQVKRQYQNNLETLVRDVSKSFGDDAMKYLKPKNHLVKGYARKEIPLLVENIKADLVVMGTVARTGIPGFLMGNTAETILNQIDCSVLAIKPPGFKTPVTLED